MSYDGFPHPPYPFTLLKGKKRRERREGWGKGRGEEEKRKSEKPQGWGKGRKTPRKSLLGKDLRTPPPFLSLFSRVGEPLRKSLYKRRLGYPHPYDAFLARCARKSLYKRRLDYPHPFSPPSGWCAGGCPPYGLRGTSPIMWEKLWKNAPCEN